MLQNDLATTRTVIRWTEFDRLTKLRGWTTDAERARQLGISQATLTNMRAGKTNAGPKVIHAVLHTFGAPVYDLLFEQVPAEGAS